MAWVSLLVCTTRHRLGFGRSGCAFCSPSLPLWRACPPASYDECYLSAYLDVCIHRVLDALHFVGLCAAVASAPFVVFFVVLIVQRGAGRLVRRVEDCVDSLHTAECLHVPGDLSGVGRRGRIGGTCASSALA